MMPSLRPVVGQSYNEPDIAGISDFPLAWGASLQSPNLDRFKIVRTGA